MLLLLGSAAAACVALNKDFQLHCGRNEQQMEEDDQKKTGQFAEER